MNEAVAGPGRRSPWRLAARAAVSLVVIAVVACAVLFAFVLSVLQCDDGCPDNYEGDWRYAAQFVLAAAAGVLTLAAAALGFTARRDAYHLAAAFAGALSVVWVVWLFDGGF
ncbi:hypothetical protein [Nocardioides rubriscoriae]|uniref:hypothetical protein n=1 Tax=Nocardioides rubriscoriae TaxID=642762 RepID=UPI0011DFF695|nr:hypothetical protein [Nocardioides rubriscoriae]